MIFRQNKSVRSNIDLALVILCNMTKHKGMGLFIGPKCLASFKLKLRGSSSDLNFLGEMSIGTLLRTTLRSLLLEVC